MNVSARLKICFYVETKSSVLIFGVDCKVVYIHFTLITYLCAPKQFFANNICWLKCLSFRPFDFM